MLKERFTAFNETKIQGKDTKGGQNFRNTTNIFSAEFN
jgi:hypothetical protein